MRNFWLGCTVIIICRLLASWIFPTYDDAFITYRYALNIVSGNGLVYNIGEKVMGTTSPLFALVSCIPIILHLPVQKFFVVFNSLCDCFSLFIAYKYILKDNPASFLLCILFFAADPMINRVSIGGMEADLFLLLSLSGLALYINGKKSFAFLLLSALYFLRPEGVILVFVLFFYDYYITRKFSFKYYLLFALVIAVPLILIYLYYGQALPQSVVAKSTMSRDKMSNLIKNIFFPDPLFFAMTPLAVYGYILQFKRNKFVLLLGTWAFLFASAYIIRGPFIWSWYTFSIEFAIIVLASVGTNTIFKKIRPGLNIAGANYCYVILLIPCIVWTGVSIYKGRSGVEEHVYKQLEKDFGSSDSMQKKIIFADDIGVVGYFSKAYIYDGLSLITPRGLKFKNAPEKIADSKPDYLFIYSDPRYIKAIKDDPVIGKKYSFYKRYSILGETENPENNSLSSWKHYSQDYVLLKRND